MQRKSNAFIMATSCRNGNSPVIFGLESNYSVNNIGYDMVFKIDTQYKNRVLENNIGLKH